MSEKIWDARVGIGLRSPHINELYARKTAPAWLEVHTENWMTESGPIAQRLAQIRTKFEISLHGVGLSLGSADGINHAHLLKLKRLVDCVQPILVSEHLSWGAINGSHSNDLLPVPYTEDNINLFVERIDSVQQFLGRQILVENLSSYACFASSSMPEWAFVNAIIERADCGLLLDINNVYVNANNHQFDPCHYLNEILWHRVGEIHLAGYEEWNEVLIDTHGRPVQAPVWDLFHRYLEKLPTTARVLIEWDNDLPSLDQLLAEADKVNQALQSQKNKEEQARKYGT